MKLVLPGDGLLGSRHGYRKICTTFVSPASDDSSHWNFALDVRTNWYGDMISVFNEKNIAWATWQYKGAAFWPVRKPDGTPDTELIKNN